MRRIVVTENISLDGVMQAPAMPDEDTRAASAEAAGRTATPTRCMIDYMTAGSEDCGAACCSAAGRTRRWPPTGRTCRRTTRSPRWINSMGKFVASRTLTGPLDWNATLLVGDLGTAVSALKETDGPDLTVLGCGVLVQSLREHGLIDEYLLSIYPLVLGSGSRLFPDGAAADLDLIDSVTTTTGVIVGRYRPQD